MNTARAVSTGSIVLAWAVFFARVIVGDAVPYYRDILMTHLPLVDFIHRQILSGHLPQWYPYETLGVPFIGQIVTAVFHPQTLIFLAFPAVLAVKWNILANYLVGLGGAYRLGRALGTSREASVAGALAFGFGGYALSMSNNLPYLTGLVTLPWVGWAAHRAVRHHRAKDAALLAFAWALVLLGGDAQSFILCPALILTAWVAEPPPRARRVRAAGILLVAAGLTAALAAIELLPAQRMSALSVRELGQAQQAHGALWALHPLRLAALVVQGFVPDAVRGRMIDAFLGGGTGFWANSLFAGSLVVAVAAVGALQAGRRGRAYAGLAIVSVWLALGRTGGLLPLVWKVGPLLAQLRFPEKYLALLQVGLAGLTAMGMERLRTAPHFKLFLGIGGAAVIAALLIPTADPVTRLEHLTGRSLVDPDAPLIVVGAWSLGLMKAAGAWLVSGAVLWRSVRAPSWLKAIPALIFLELCAGNGDQLPTVSPEVLRPNDFIARVLASTDGATPSHRVIPLSAPRWRSTVTLGDGEHWTRGMLLAMRPSAVGPYGVTSFGEDLPGTDARQAAMFGPRGVAAVEVGPDFDGCFRVLDDREAPRAGDALLARDPGYSVGLWQTPCRPRAYLAAAQPVADVRSALAAYRAGLGPSSVVWEGGSQRDQAQGAVRWVSNEPGRLLLHADADRPAALVINEHFSPGWSATVDGVSAPIHPVDAVAQGVELPEGGHDVELAYQTPGLILGAWITGAGLVLALGLVLPIGRRPRRQPDAV